MDTETSSVRDLIPDRTKIKQRLGENYREAKILRRLLKLAQQASVTTGQTSREVSHAG